MSGASLRLANSNAQYFLGEALNDVLITSASSNQRILLGNTPGQYPMLLVNSNQVNVGGTMNTANVSTNLLQATGIHLTTYDPSLSNTLEVVAPLYLAGGGGGSGGTDTATSNVAYSASNQAFRGLTLDVFPDTTLTRSTIFRTSNIERMRITSNGYVGIGTSSPTQALHVEGQLYVSNDITAFSDSNHKHAIEPIADALDKLGRVRGYTFAYDDDASGRRHAGVLAQEVRDVLPEVVNENPDGRLSVAYGNLSALLINAIRELKQEVDTIKSST
jgi:hypothetical protein